MKNIILTAFTVLLITRSCYAQSKQLVPIVVSGPKIEFDQLTFDFGTVPYMGNGTHVYVFTNTGTEPVILTNVVKGCGCTAVDWTRTPVLPGKKGMVKATYNTRHVGLFNKGVDVYNNSAVPRINLRLKGTVEALPQEGSN